MPHSVELSQCTVTRGVYSQGNRERDRQTQKGWQADIDRTRSNTRNG